MVMIPNIFMITLGGLTLFAAIYARDRRPQFGESRRFIGPGMSNPSTSVARQEAG